MKLNKTLGVAAVAVLVLASCSGNKSSESKSEELSTETLETTYTVDNSASVVAWKGEVAGVYGHNGVIDLTEGSITVKGEVVTGGKVVIDMTSIQPLDSASYKDEDGKRATDLVGHLTTDDFFLVEEFPTATFLIKSHEGNQLVGDLTIRGTTKEENATVNSISVTPEGLSGKATLIFNRQDYGVSWEHYMKDMVLSNDITVNLDLVAKP